MFLHLVKMQRGGSMPVFAGAAYQRGYGVGRVMKNMLREATPLLKQAGKQAESDFQWWPVASSVNERGEPDLLVRVGMLRLLDPLELLVDDVLLLPELVPLLLFDLVPLGLLLHVGLVPYVQLPAPRPVREKWGDANERLRGTSFPINRGIPRHSFSWRRDVKECTSWLSSIPPVANVANLNWNCLVYHPLKLLWNRHSGWNTVPSLRWLIVDP